MINRWFFLGFPILFLLAACNPDYFKSKKVPESQQEYAGIWVNQKDLLSSDNYGDSNLTLIGIGKNRGVLYIDNNTNGHSCSFSQWSTPKIDDKQIKISMFFFFDDTYQIDEPPYQESGNWKMILDGETFNRVEEGNSHNLKEMKSQLWEDVCD